MGRSANPPDLVGQMQRMQEQIRQLRMKRAPAGGAVAVEAQIIIPAASLGVGWTGGDTAATSGLTPKYYRDRGRVYLSGVVTYTSAAGSNGAQPLRNVPSGYQPKFLAKHPTHVDDANTGTTTPAAGGKRWIGQFLPPPSASPTDLTQWFNLDQHPDFLASPNFGNPPTGTYLVLDGLSYTHL